MPISSCSSSSSFSTSACTVTSSAVVGSSAMTMSGLSASAMAIITRWRWPPENWCGYLCIEASGSGMPTRRISARARASASGAGHAVDAHHLAELPADGVDRVQVAERVLEDHGDALAVDLPALAGGHGEQVPAVEQHLAAR